MYTFKKWIEMKHEQILEKVRNSFVYASKRSPQKKQCFKSKPNMNLAALNAQKTCLSSLASQNEVERCSDNCLLENCNQTGNNILASIEKESDDIAATTNEDASNTAKFDHNEDRCTPTLWTSGVASSARFPSVAHFEVNFVGEVSANSFQKKEQKLCCGSCTQDTSETITAEVAVPRASDDYSLDESLEGLLSAIDTVLDSMTKLHGNRTKLDIDRPQSTPQNNLIYTTVKKRESEASTIGCEETNTSIGALFQQSVDKLVRVSSPMSERVGRVRQQSNQCNDSFLLFINQALGPLDDVDPMP
jgi:hypothetical protein